MLSKLLHRYHRIKAIIRNDLITVVLLIPLKLILFPIGWALQSAPVKQFNDYRCDCMPAGVGDLNINGHVKLFSHIAGQLFHPGTVIDKRGLHSELQCVA